MASNEARGPLAGVTVIEMAGLGPAPFCGMMFADMGANVILVDRKVTRSKTSSNNASATDHRLFEICHRNKRSIAVDLKRHEGAELILTLIEKADILIEGFRPGVMERLGLGPNECFDKNQALVFGRMTGWGQEGPLAKTAGHEPNYLAIAGAYHYARHGGAPWSPMTMAGDVGAGATLLAWGCLAALFEARQTGRGRVVDAAIVDGAVYNSALLMMLRNSGQIAQSAGQSWVDGAAPWSDVYECADGGHIILCALEPQFYACLLDRLSLTTDPSFLDQWDKIAWPQMREKLETKFQSKSREEWAEIFDACDACAAPVLSFDEARGHPHMKARSVYLDAQGGHQPAIAPRIDGNATAINPPPKIGEQAKDILLEFNVSKITQSKLSQDGII